MKSVSIAVHILLNDAVIQSLVSDRVYPVYAPQGTPLPYIVVGLISETEEDMLEGSSQLHDGRVSIESRCVDVIDLKQLGEAAVDAMRDKIELAIPAPVGCTVTTRKAATDEIDAGNQTGADGAPDYVRRITDWYCFWRKSG